MKPNLTLRAQQGERRKEERKGAMAGRCHLPLCSRTREGGHLREAEMCHLLNKWTSANGFLYIGFLKWAVCLLAALRHGSAAEGAIL